MSAFLTAALDYARQGMAVFPLLPKSKKPLTPNGFHDASRDPEVITKWWTAHPTANIGGVPASAGLIALDIDSPSCWSVAQSLGLLSEPTHEVVTGTNTPGARCVHLYFRHPAPAQDTRLGDAIIVRGARGYVVLPPSVHPVTGQVYHSETTIADAIALPDRAAILLMAQSRPPASAERVTSALSAPEVTLGGRHAALVTVAGTLAAHGLLGDEGRALLHGYNATRCSPPKDASEVDAIWGYVATREGAKREAVAAVRDTVDLSALTTNTTTPTTTRTILRMSELMQESPTIPFLIDQLIPLHGLGVLWAPSGVGKTFTTLDLALHVATGRPWQGRAVTPATVLWVVGEGFPGMRSRIHAWCVEHSVDASELETTFFTRRVAWDMTAGAHRYEVLEELATLHATPSLIVIDTLSSNGPAGFDESSTRDMKALMDAARVVRDTFPAMVFFTHHTGHDTTRMRGSSDQLGAVDVSLKLTPGKDGAVTLSVEKARDFARPEPVALVLTPAHGAQVVRSGDPVDIGALIAATKHSHLSLLSALFEHGRPLRPKELETVCGLGKYTYQAVTECVTAQYLIVHAVGGSKSYELSDAGLRIVKANRPTPVLPFNHPATLAGSTGQNLVSDQPLTM